MSINFSTLQGLTIPEGVVTQITDASGRVLWAAANDKPVILQVEKITSDTYAGETTYTGEQFILLDIYPKKSNSVVNVTYGGLTKTLTFSGTNAQTVFFGTFNGVADTTTTPASGALIIEGGCKGFAVGTYKQYNSSTSKSTSKYCACVTTVTDWGSIEYLPSSAFYDCTSLALTSLPSGLTSIGSYAFYGCTSLALTSLPSGLTSIGSSAFYGCTSLALTSLPSGLTSIGSSAFYGCTSLALTSLPSGLTSIGSSAFEGCKSLALTSLPSGLTSIGSRVFYGCTSLALTSLPNGITSIEGSAFYNCISLALTSLPSGLTSIGSSAFYGCCKISIGEIPEGVTTIGSFAFAAYYNYKHSMPSTIVLPSTIVEIGDNAFTYVTSSGSSYYSCITDVIIIRATTPPTISAGTFGAFSTSAVYGPDNITVPNDCGDAYKATDGWISYADIITEGS